MTTSKCSFLKDACLRMKRFWWTTAKETPKQFKEFKVKRQKSKSQQSNSQNTSRSMQSSSPTSVYIKSASSWQILTSSPARSSPTRVNTWEYPLFGDRKWNFWPRPPSISSKTNTSPSKASTERTSQTTRTLRTIQISSLSSRQQLPRVRTNVRAQTSCKWVQEVKPRTLRTVRTSRAARRVRTTPTSSICSENWRHLTNTYLTSTLWFLRIKTQSEQALLELLALKLLLVLMIKFMEEAIVLKNSLRKSCFRHRVIKLKKQLRYHQLVKMEDNMGLKWLWWTTVTILWFYLITNSVKLQVWLAQTILSKR